MARTNRSIPTSIALLVNFMLCAGSVPAAAQPRTSAETLFEQATQQIGAKDFAKARQLLQQARRAAGKDMVALDRAVYLEATVAAYARDYEAATKTLVAHLNKATARRDSPAAFGFHNNLMMLREAQGDLSAALIECYQMRDVGERGTWTIPERPRMTQVLLKDYWHRAFLLRMLAQRVDGSRKAATLAYAEHARREYGRLASTQKGFGDSMAVLEAFFALHDGKKAVALKAARKVNLAENDDVEDLYLVQIALDFGGDAKGAAKVAEKIRTVSYVSHAVPIMIDWIERDQAAKTGTPHFSPRYPAANP